MRLHRPVEVLPSGYELRHHFDLSGVTIVTVVNPIGDPVQSGVAITEARAAYGNRPWPPPHWTVGGSMTTTKPAPTGTVLRNVELPWSEVCMSMRIAGCRMDVELLPHGMAQLWSLDGEKFSFPITTSEAGVSNLVA